MRPILPRTFNPLASDHSCTRLLLSATHPKGTGQLGQILVAYLTCFGSHALQSPTLLTLPRYTITGSLLQSQLNPPQLGNCRLPPSYVFDLLPPRSDIITQPLTSCILDLYRKR